MSIATPEKAVIFDLDGVLTDTVEQHYLSWRCLMDEIGVPFDREINDRLRGRTREESLEIILGPRIAEFSPERRADLLRRKNETFLRLIANMTSVDLFPGVLELLKDLGRHGVPLAVASSSRNAELILGRLGVRSFFRIVIDANQVPRSKPHPDVYLVTAERLGIPPYRCIAVEDGASGIAAARAAGMTVIGVGPTPLVALADRIYPDMQSLTADLLFKG